MKIKTNKIGRRYIAIRDFVAAAQLDERAARYLSDQCREEAKSSGRPPLKLDGFTAYYLDEIRAAFVPRSEKIGRKYGQEVAENIAAALKAIDENEPASEPEPADPRFFLAENPTPPPSDDLGKQLRETVAALSNERAENARLSLEISSLREMAATADDDRRAAAVARRDLGIAVDRIKGLEKTAARRKTGRGVEILSALFSSPVFLFAPLAGIIGASFGHMGIVFSAAFPSAVASWIMAAVFSSVVLVFTFNSKGRIGAGFGVGFAVVEFLINGVYFGFLPASIVPAVAALAFPVALLAYTHLFTNKTKTAGNE